MNSSVSVPWIGFVVRMPSNVDLNIRDDLLAQATLILLQISQLLGHEHLLLPRLIDCRYCQAFCRWSRGDARW